MEISPSGMVFEEAIHRSGQAQAVTFLGPGTHIADLRTAHLLLKGCRILEDGMFHYAWA
jgi:hypothetical protein